jgi:hypothetical protein
MVKSSHVPPPNPSDEEDFKPKSFIIFCLDDNGDMAFEASWGDTLDDVKNFATLLKKIFDGELDNIVVNQMKEQSKLMNDGSKKYAIFAKTYKNLSKPLDLVIDPTEVELN